MIHNTNQIKKAKNNRHALFLVSYGIRILLITIIFGALCLSLTHNAYALDEEIIRETDLGPAKNLRVVRKPLEDSLTITVESRDSEDARINPRSLTISTMINLPNFDGIRTDNLCGDGACDVLEDYSTCPEDCDEIPDCGNGVRDPDETCINCPEDLGEEFCRCGDGICESANSIETCASCPEDCSPCCGDGTCDELETHCNCSFDCEDDGSPCG